MNVVAKFVIGQRVWDIPPSRQEIKACPTLFQHEI